MPFPVAIITTSDRAARGEYADVSGPCARQMFWDAGFTDVEVTVVPDEQETIEEAIVTAVKNGARCVVTTGGTGLGPRDVTVEATLALADAEVPGITEEVRRRGVEHTPTAILSRARSVRVHIDGHLPALVVNAPGSPGGVTDTLAVLLPVVEHLIGQMDGTEGHQPPLPAPRLDS